MKIEVVAKNLYGKERFYPISADAIFLSAIANKPSLSMKQLLLCKNAGYNVSITSKKYDLSDYEK